MRLHIITPIGPGHEQFAARCRASIDRADPGPFEVRHVDVNDSYGWMGRSKARNLGIDIARGDGSDWLFFLDADDQLMPDALTLNEFASPATFGAISLAGRISRENMWPCRWRDLPKVVGTLTMGFFCRADLGLRFDESLDAGEDFDFYLRLPSFVKLKRPLVDIGYNDPSAGGPRGYDRLDWAAACRIQVERAMQREPEKFA